MSEQQNINKRKLEKILIKKQDSSVPQKPKKKNQIQI